MKTLLCPYCLVEVDTERKCPECGECLDQGDWPSIHDSHALTPFSAENLLPPGPHDIHYRMKPLSEGAQSEKGELRIGLPYHFGDSECITFGPNFEDAIEMHNVDGVQAAILRNRYTKEFYLYDCGCRSGMYVNGKRCHGRVLQDNDRITVAGIDFRFRGDRIESDREVEGMAIGVKDLTFRVKGRVVPVLDQVSFSIMPGEFVGVLGPSGCGKSSLVQRMVGLADVDEGEILVNGHSLDDTGALEKFLSTTAYLPQNVDETLHDSLTVKEEIECFRRIHLAASDDDDAENENCLKMLGLAGRGDSLIGKLSGGEKRRVGIALALLRRPQLLMLDEPGAGLDPASENELVNHLRGVADQGRTVVCVTHVLANLERFDKVLVLSNGRVVYYGPPEDLLSEFAAVDYAALYRKLATGVDRRVESPATDRTESEFPTVKPPSACRRMSGYLRRLAREFLGVRNGAGAGTRAGLFARMFSLPAIFFIWQPLCLVVGLRIACACYFRENGGRAVDLELLGFCASLSMFWIGINNSAREFVKERIPGRCLERMSQVPLMPYILAKLVWTTSICILQAVSFTTLLCMAGRIQVPLAEAVESPCLAISFMWFFPLCLSCLTGAYFGLAISASSKKQLSAVSVVPNIAITALLFSNAVVQFEYGNGFYAPVAKWLSTSVMPCHWASKVLDSIQAGMVERSVVLHMLVQFLAYALMAFAVIIWRQNKNELEWDGRDG